MKRLFMDSGGPSPPPVSHHCSSMLDRGFGTFASTPPATRLRTVGQARHRMSEVSSRGDAGGRMSLSSAPANEIAVCEPPTTDSNVLGLERVLFRGEPFLRQEERFIHNVVWSRQAGRLFPPRSDRTNKDSLLGSKQGDPWVRGTYYGPIGFLGKGGVAVPGVSSCWEQPLRPRPAPTTSRPQGVAVLRGRVAVPTRLGRDKQGDPWVPGTRREPVGFLAKSDLAYGNDREVRRPSGTVRPNDWTRLT
jgi:hypothetical protein